MRFVDKNALSEASMHEELFELINQGLSDVEILSDEDDGWGSESENVPVLPPEDTSPEIDNNDNEEDCCEAARIDRFARPPLSSDLEMKKKGRGTSEELMSEDGRTWHQIFKASSQKIHARDGIKEHKIT
ncbi:hypothetical protein ILUMI_03857 [Ignelater luminosus]|uniref:Uncharacterized protein n=1 Tax=Ignelater luminosus TaxID=2038154 RepID=A0A8K0DFI9_IGNLU|nr:hypothetical protein ILUMI_03857 [Ignelater luminosus]